MQAGVVSCTQLAEVPGYGRCPADAVTAAFDSLNVATNGSASALEKATTVPDDADPFLKAPQMLGDKSSAAHIEGCFPLLARITGPEVARNE